MQQTKRDSTPMMRAVSFRLIREFGIRECCYNTTSSGQLLTVIPGIDPESSVISVIILMF